MLKEKELNNIRSFRSYCELEHCEINGVVLDYYDFGDKYDTDTENAEEYGCGWMKFIPYDEVKQETLKKYNITEDEYRKIQDKLDCLSFGNCGWCI